MFSVTGLTSRTKDMDRLSIPLIIAKGYRAIVEGDPRLKEVPKPPILAYRSPSTVLSFIK